MTMVSSGAEKVVEVMWWDESRLMEIEKSNGDGGSITIARNAMPVI